jgi:hypothetical protein
MGLQKNDVIRDMKAIKMDTVGYVARTEKKTVKAFGRKTRGEIEYKEKLSVNGWILQLI